MAKQIPVLEYKCPCCDAALIFSDELQQMKCDYCDNVFDKEAILEYNHNPADNQEPDFSWEESTQSSWSEKETTQLQTFTCPACGGELLSDAHTAATFCPYCDNPAILPGRVSGGWKPDAVIPFSTGKEDAQKAFSKLCKGKPLLPKDFANQHRIEKITGMYVPFWLYSCSGDQAGTYRATRVRHWSDAKYNYTKTDYYLVKRAARAEYEGIPMDASTKMNDAIMESIEPFDYDKMTDFDTAYLSGYLADKYDVESSSGEGRIRQRVGNTMDDMIRTSLLGYTTAIPTHQQLHISHSKAKYVLLPVWMLYSKYKDQTYVFAMNGQTGKMTGTFPICPKRSAAWFGGVCAAVAILVTLIQYFAM